MPDAYFVNDRFSLVWDEDKNRKNIEKHGIALRLATKLERNAYNNNVIGRY